MLSRLGLSSLGRVVWRLEPYITDAPEERPAPVHGICLGKSEAARQILEVVAETHAQRVRPCTEIKLAETANGAEL